MKIPLLAILIFTAPLHAESWTLQKLPDRWRLNGFEGSFDLSGIAAINGSHCLVGTDELFSVQPGVIDRSKRRITARPSVPLMKLPAGAKKVEVDVEGIAVAPERNAYYVTGSHGVGKKKGDFQPARLSVFEVPVDPSTGRIDRNRIRRGSLAPWLEKSRVFRNFVGKPLQQNGMNFEGIAYAKGKLWFGTRGPNVRGTSYVIEADPESLFNQGTPHAKEHALAIGDGRGIREITAVRDGFLVLTGNSAAEATKQIPISLARRPDATFELFFWKPGQKVRLIGKVPEVPGKAEAMLVLEETDAYIDLLVIYDSAPDGGPQAIRVLK